MTQEQYDAIQPIMTHLLAMSPVERDIFFSQSPEIEWSANLNSIESHGWKLDIDGQAVMVGRDIDDESVDTRLRKKKRAS